MSLEEKIPKQHEPKMNASDARDPAISASDIVRTIPDLWQRAFDASPDLISIHDTRHRLIAVNKAMAEITGRTPQDLVGCYCYDVVHQTECPLALCPHTLLLKDGQSHQIEHYEKTLDTWLLVTVDPLYDSHQQLIGSIHIARDINTQKLDQQALKESEERFHQLSEATMDGVFLSDGSTIILANQVLSEMVGYSRDELKGMSLFRFITPGQRERLIRYLRTRQTGQYEFECVRKDGSRFPVQAHARTVSYKNKLVYQTAIRDLTEQKQMEQERATHDRLQGVLEMAGAVCHEINQPLTAIYGYMDLLTANLPHGHPTAGKTDKIEAQMQRIEKIIRQLMHITQYKTKAYPGGNVIVDIHRSTLDEPE